MCEDACQLHLLIITKRKKIVRIMKKLNLIGIVSVGLLLASCSDTEGGHTENDNREPVITTRLADFDGGGQTIDGENDVEDMQACLFEDGVMTKVYKNLPVSSDGYNLQLKNLKGNLYMLANTANAIDLEKLQAEGITETEWLKTSFSPVVSETGHFFTGVLALDARGQRAVTKPITLKRGVARFDLVLNVAGDVEVNSLTLTNVARSVYLFPQGDAVKSPDNTERRDTTVAFLPAVVQEAPGVLYVYEQENNGMEIKVEAGFDGGAVKTMTKTLEGDLKRNHVYTITVNKDYIDVTVKPNFEDWEDGGNTDMSPDALL